MTLSVNIPVSSNRRLVYLGNILRNLLTQLLYCGYPIILITLVITLMQVIYSYIPETNPVSSVHTVGAAPYLQFMLHVVLFRPRNMLCTFTSALPSVCVQYTIWLFVAVP